MQRKRPTPQQIAADMIEERNLEGDEMPEGTLRPDFPPKTSHSASSTDDDDDRFLAKMDEALRREGAVIPQSTGSSGTDSPKTKR